MLHCGFRRTTSWSSKPWQGPRAVHDSTLRHQPAADVVPVTVDVHEWRLAGGVKASIALGAMASRNSVTGVRRRPEVRGQKSWSELACCVYARLAKCHYAHAVLRNRMKANPTPLRAGLVNDVKDVANHAGLCQVWHMQGCRNLLPVNLRLIISSRMPPNREDCPASRNRLRRQY